MAGRRRHQTIVGGLNLASAVGWVAILVSDSNPFLPRICSAGGWNLSSSALVAASINPIGMLFLSYLAMIFAMMVPLLKQPVRELSDRTIKSARPITIFVFVIAYLAVWSVLAPMFGLAVVALDTGFASGSNLPSALCGLFALAWHMTPWRQTMLNRCHRRLNLFVAKPPDIWLVFVAGLTQGLFCGASCAPIMLWAMMQGAWHLPAMILVAIFVWVERQLSPEIPIWGPAALVRTVERFRHFSRYCLARTRLSLARVSQVG